MFRFYKCKDIVPSIVKIRLKTCWHCKIDKPMLFIDECITHALYQVGNTPPYDAAFAVSTLIKNKYATASTYLMNKDERKDTKRFNHRWRAIFSRWSVVVHWPVDMFPLASGRISTGLWKHVHDKVDDDWSAFIKWLIASKKSSVAE